MGLVQKYAINKKSTILMLPCWNFGNLTYPWVGHFDQVSSKLHKNWQFFINSTFLGQSHFFPISLYLYNVFPFYLASIFGTPAWRNFATSGAKAWYAHSKGWICSSVKKLSVLHYEDFATNYENGKITI